MYKYKGDGLGIPGLPHEITEEQAHEYKRDYLAATKRLNREEKLSKRKADIRLSAYPHVQLQAALQSGAYKKEGKARVKPSKTKKAKEADNG